VKQASVIFTTALFCAVAVLLVACGGQQSSSSNSSSGKGGSTLSYQVSDSCYDGNTIYFRFFDETDNLLWPTASTYYDATQGNTYSMNLQCTTGANICFGASENTNTDSPYWGVGSNNSEPCTNCCVTCAATSVTGTLTCSGNSAMANDSNTDSNRPSGRRRELIFDALQPDK